MASGRFAAQPGFEQSIDDSADREQITGEAVALDIRPTSYILRAAGAGIDWCVSGGLFLVFVLLIVNVGGSALDHALATALVTASLVVAIVVTPIAVELALHGRSLGKLAVGGRIVRDDGGAISFRHAFVRALMGVVEIYLTFGGLAALVGLLNAKSKRLGDLLAGTYSQHERIARVATPVYGVPTELVEWSHIADVARLPDRLSRRISSFLSQAPGFTPAARIALAAELASEAARYVSPLPRVSPESFLAGVAVIRRERDFAAQLIERERLDRLQPVLGALPHAFPDR